MKCNRLLVLAILCLLALPGYSQPVATEVETYTTVELRLTEQEIPQIASLGLAMDCCYHQFSRGYHIFQIPVNKEDLALLKEKKIAYSVVMEDTAAFYAERAQKMSVEGKAIVEEQRQALRTEMQLGSMSGAYKIEEVPQILDKLYAKYGAKNLISQKVVIGKSYEGRDIYMVKISDNVNVDEGGVEPQALYTGLHHAREPQGMMTLFYFMYYLLENYDSNQRVHSIVDNRELYFIPVVNPDGYAYNQANYPNGGGMWRKNRGGKADLNRNYGPQELWNYANGGSSTSPSSDTYRGTAPFSEPETKVVRDFVVGKKFRTALNYHTYSNLLIYPWGYKDVLADPKFKTMAVEMTKINGYSYGTAQGLLYAVRGDSDDWFFQEAKVYAMTPEVGGSSDGFWPKSTRVFPLAQENLEANLLLAEYAGQVK